MAITKVLAPFILSEHRYRPIEGEALLLGRQTVHFTADEVVALLGRFGLPLDRLDAVRLDTSTDNGRRHGFISDLSFFRLFTDATVTTMDVTRYEGCDIVHDVNHPVPAELEGRFDFIFDGGTFDNVFDPSMAIRNTARMLKPGGRIIHHAAAGSYPNAYVSLSPDWFLDFYVLNRFRDAKAYIAVNVSHPPSGEQSLADEFDLYAWWPLRKVSDQAPSAYANPIGSHLYISRIHELVLVAEKAFDAAWDRMPVQLCYRFDLDRERYADGYRRLLSAQRPWLDRPVFEPTDERRLMWVGHIA